MFNALDQRNASIGISVKFFFYTGIKTSLTLRICNHQPMDRICQDQMLPNENFDSTSEERFVRDQLDSPVMGEEPEQCFDYTQNSNMWGPQRQSAESTINPGYDRMYINHDFRPRPPTFDGKPDSWEPFLMQMRLMSQSYGWPDRKFREQLMFALRGEALLFASNLPHVTVENTESLLQAIGQRFGQCLLAETHRANLYNLKKQSKESLQQYSARVSSLMSRAYPGMQGTAIFDNLAIEHLLRGLPDQKLAYEIFTKKPKNLSDAVDMITWHKACQQYTTKKIDGENLSSISRICSIRYVSGNAHDEAKFDKWDQITNDHHRERRCYNCRERGHEATECHLTH